MSGEHQSLQPKADTAPNRSAATAPGQGQLLVIDDDVSIRTLIGKLGERAGFAATHAASLDEAARLLDAHRFDCITLDLNIGKDNGIEVLRILAKTACAALIIVVSGSLPSKRDLAMAIGNMTQLNLLPPIGKPIDFAKLRATLADIKRQLDQRRATRPAA